MEENIDTPTVQTVRQEIVKARRAHSLDAKHGTFIVTSCQRLSCNNNSGCDYKGKTGVLLTAQLKATSGRGWTGVAAPGGAYITVTEESPT